MESSGENMPPPQPQSPQPTKHTALPTAGGVLLLIAGIIALINWIWVAFVGGSFGAYMSTIPGAEGFGGLGAILVVCGVIGIIFSIIALVGGVMAIQRKMWGLALAGSVLGLFTIGFVFVSSILSLIALILIALSKAEFQ